MSHADDPILLRVLSLGAGVQSSTLYLMAVRGEFGEKRPTVAIFADTQWEPRAVYAWLDYLESVGGSVLPIHRVTAGHIRRDALPLDKGAAPTSGRARSRVSLPLFVKNQNGSRGIVRRQCTTDYKVRPIRKEVRRILGRTGRPILRGTLVESWQGISLDEATRMRTSGEWWIENRYPLIDRGMSRRDCVRWLERAGYPEPPKSACIGCPFTGDARWRAMKTNAPEEWADAVAFDKAMRHSMPGLNQDAFLHDSLVPLDEVDLSTAEERGQVNMFENECEGMCGV